MWTSPLSYEARGLLTDKGQLTTYDESGFLSLIELPFQSIFPEIHFPLGQIPHFFETRYYLQYLGFNADQASNLFNGQKLRDPEPLINQFTLLVVSKKYILDCINTIPSTDIFCKKVSELGDLNLGSEDFTWNENLCLANDVKDDVARLIEAARKDERVMDRYVASFLGAKKFEDLIMMDYIVEVMDRRFMNLVTLERDARRFLKMPTKRDELS